MLLPTHSVVENLVVSRVEALEFIKVVLARQRNLSDSAFLQRLVELAAQNAGVTMRSSSHPWNRSRAEQGCTSSCAQKVTCCSASAQPDGEWRLPPTLQWLCGHVRAVAPLPDREFAELKRAP